MAKADAVKRDTFLYEVGRVLAWAAVRLFIPVRYHGQEKLRGRKGPFVLISNHQHALDPVVLALCVREQCVFLAKKELAANGLLRWMFRQLHCIMVDRHNSDMEAMRACMQVIRDGRVLVIFPEGTRHHEGQMEQIENGTSLIVLRGGVPLIPVYIDRPLKLFRRCNAWVGEPIGYGDLLEQGTNRNSCEALNERMRETYRKMIAEHGAG